MAGSLSSFHALRTTNQELRTTNHELFGFVGSSWWVLGGIQEGEKVRDESNARFGYEKLEVWQEAVDWACRVISIVDHLGSPRNHYRLVEQLEAAASSVAMNIAEGKGRYSKKEFVHYLYIARGSLYETVTLLEIFRRLRWFDDADLRPLGEHAAQIGRMLNSLINSIKKP